MERASQLLLTFLTNSAWLIAVICAITALCSLLLRRARASFRHTLWLAALLLSALIPLWSLQGASSPVTTASTLADHAAEPVLSTFVVANANAPESRHHLPRFAPLHVPRAVAWTVSGCYILFLLYRSVLLGVAAWRTRALNRAAVGPVSTGQVTSIVDRYASAFHLKNAPSVYLTESVGPVTSGIRQPRLFLPLSFAESASESEMISAVCHELAHIRRRDFLMNLACELLFLPVSFHPAAALIKARIDSSRELACDDLAAEMFSAPALYARSLLSIARSMSSSMPVRRFGYGQGLFDTQKMEERIVNLVGNRKLIGERWAHALAVATLCLLAAASVGAASLCVQVAQATSSANVQSEATAAKHSTRKQNALASRPTAAALPNPATPDESRRTRIREFTLLGGNEIADAQAVLSKDLKSQTYGEDIAAELGDRVRVFYQDHGYLKVIVGQPQVKQFGREVDVTISVNAGQQYRLKDIQFTGNKAVSNTELRPLIPLQPGEVFTTSAIRTGIETIRQLYGRIGYVEATPVVSFKLDDSSGTIQMWIQIDEGPSSERPTASTHPAALAVRVSAKGSSASPGADYGGNQLSPVLTGAVLKWRT